MLKTHDPATQEPRQKYHKIHYDSKQARQKPQEIPQMSYFQRSNVIQIKTTNQSYQSNWLDKLVDNIREDKLPPKNTNKSKGNLTYRYYYDNSLTEPAYIKIPSVQYPSSSRPHSITKMVNDYSNQKYQSQKNHVFDSCFIDKVKAKSKQSRNQLNHNKLQQYKINNLSIHQNTTNNKAFHNYGKIIKSNQCKNSQTQKQFHHLPNNQHINSINFKCNNQKTHLRNYTTIQNQLTKLPPQTPHINNEQQIIYQSTVWPIEQIRQFRKKISSGIHSTIQTQQQKPANPSKYRRKSQQPCKKQTKELISTFPHSTQQQFQFRHDTGPIKTKQPTQLKQQKQQLIKMDQMAKRLNQVLQNTNIKSNNKNNKIDNTSHQQPKKYSNYFSSNQRYEPKTIQPSKKNSYSKPVYIDYTKKKETYQQSIPQPKPQPLIIPQQKEELMKRHLSLKSYHGINKHIPSQIILQQQSCSQLTSQLSPRTPFPNLQIKTFFDQLDTNKLTQQESTAKDKNNNNIAMHKINVIKTECNGNQQKVYYDSSQKNKKQQKGSQTNKKSTIQRQMLNDNNYNSKKNIQKVHWVFPETPSFQKTKSSTLTQNNNPIKNSYFFQSSSTNELTHQTKALNHPSLPKNQTKYYSHTQQPRNTQKTISHQKQNSVTSPSSPIKDCKQPKRDFEKICQNLNTKLDNYITTMTKKQLPSHKISLQFFQLSKHWNRSP